MTYRLIARDKIFCEGSRSECEKYLTNISRMANIIDTDYEMQEFSIIKYEKTKLV